MKLSGLLCDIDYKLLYGNIDCEIIDICYDSRKAENGKIFVALSGTNVDGHNYIQSAYDKGVRVFVIEKIIDFAFDDATFVLVDNSRKAQI